MARLEAVVLGQSCVSRGLFHVSTAAKWQTTSFSDVDMPAVAELRLLKALPRNLGTAGQSTLCKRFIAVAVPDAVVIKSSAGL